MKKSAAFLIALFCVFGLAACWEEGAGQSDVLKNETLSLELELDADYDDSDPFVNECLFCASEDLTVLEATGSFQMRGEKGRLEIKNNKTGEILWSNTWEESVENATFSISLEDIKKENEYVLCLTGTKIEQATAVVTFESRLVQARDRPSQ